MSRQDDFISQQRQAATQFLEAYDTWMAGQREWNALDYGNTLDQFNGENEDFTKEQIGSVIFDTANAIGAVLAQGHATNLHRIRK